MQDNQINKLIEDIKNNRVTDGTVDNAVNSLSEEQKKNLYEIMGNRDLLRKIAESPKGRLIMDILKGK